MKSFEDSSSSEVPNSLKEKTEKLERPDREKRERSSTKTDKKEKRTQRGISFDEKKPKESGTTGMSSLSRSEIKKHAIVSPLPSVSAQSRNRIKESREQKRRNTVLISSPTSFSHVGGYGVEQGSQPVNLKDNPSENVKPERPVDSTVSSRKSTVLFSSPVLSSPTVSVKDPSKRKLSEVELPDLQKINRTEPYKARHNKGSDFTVLENMKNNINSNLPKSNWQVHKDLEGKIFYVKRSPQF